MPPTPRYIDATDASRLTFSVCALVADQAKYDRLLASFDRAGFTAGNAEFLAADNRQRNQFDGYSWHKTLLAEARGRFVIFCHDDIELIDDGFDALLGWTSWLDREDPAWLLAGVAGCRWRPGDHGRPDYRLHISDRFGQNRRKGEVPCRAETLDECFIMMRRCRPVVSSYDLGGFHFYGPDLCLQAEILGGSAYVIDFHLRHHGNAATGKPYRASRRSFARKYRQFFPGRTLHCTTGLVSLDAAAPADAEAPQVAEKRD